MACSGHHVPVRSCPCSAPKDCWGVASCSRKRVSKCSWPKSVRGGTHMALMERSMQFEVANQPGGIHCLGVHAVGLLDLPCISTVHHNNRWPCGSVATGYMIAVYSLYIVSNDSAAQFTTRGMPKTPTMQWPSVCRNASSSRHEQEEKCKEPKLITHQLKSWADSSYSRDRPYPHASLPCA
jgi:hypothetical protein